MNRFCCSKLTSFIKYLFKIKVLSKIKVFKLLHNNRIADETLNVYIGNIFEVASHDIKVNCGEIKLLGCYINLDSINWCMDYNTSYVFDNNRFDKIQFSKLFGRGIDVKNPWELSRLQFAARYVFLYRRENDIKYYNEFKSLVIDWSQNNKFLYGVNWTCTMEVAIRSVNLCIITSMFKEVFYEDKQFANYVMRMLLEHARYITAFPEKPINGRANNHLTSDYCGLFVISRMIDSEESKRWQEESVKGLEYCIRDQILDDGCDFECSIPYHRLMTEIFIICALLDADRTIFSKEYYTRLFKMLLFVNSYIDENGNAPQMGDNDSGVILNFSNVDNQNHKYLIELGSYIYDEIKYSGKSTLNIIPTAKQKKLCKAQLLVKNEISTFSNSYKSGGYYILKNSKFTLVVYCPSQKNVYGHRHHDAGNFTLSVNGNPLIVDSGTGRYTTDLDFRNRMKSYSNHNVYYTAMDLNKFEGYFEFNARYYCEVKENTSNMLSFTVKESDRELYKRTFRISPNDVIIEDEFYKNNFSQYKGSLLFNGHVNIIDKYISGIYANIEFVSDVDCNIEEYEYAVTYGDVLNYHKVVYIPRKKNIIKIS